MSAKTSLLFVTLALGVVGCGSGVQPVNGKVVFADGSVATDLAGYHISFQSPTKKSASGIIKPDGSFTLGSLTDSDGAEIGKHRVAIERPADEIGKPKLGRWIDEKYGSFDTSHLEIEVKRGANTPTLTVQKLKTN